MATITAELIKDLRQRTGVGMSKCKEALEQAEGNLDLAIDNLRKSGIASAVKKEGRETKEGVIIFQEENDLLALFELSAETDFVVNNEHFQNFARQLVQQIAQQRPADIQTLLSSQYMAEPNFTVEEKRALIIQSIGENIQPKRFELISKNSNATFGLYSHMGGKIVTMVVLEGSASEKELANDLAMHVCASAPEYLNPESIPAEFIEKEREIARSQMQNKPANMLESIVEGKLKSYYKESCFLQQSYLKDAKLSVEQVVEARSKQINQPLKVVQYARWSVK
jgi:elongation factor Ts